MGVRITSIKKFLHQEKSVSMDREAPVTKDGGTAGCPMEINRTFYVD